MDVGIEVGFSCQKVGVVQAREHHPSEECELKRRPLLVAMRQCQRRVRKIRLCQQIDGRGGIVGDFLCKSFRQCRRTGIRGRICQSCMMACDAVGQYSPGCPETRGGMLSTGRRMIDTTDVLLQMCLKAVFGLQIALEFQRILSKVMPASGKFSPCGGVEF